MLIVLVANWNYQLASDFQLFNQGRRNLLSASSNMNTIIGRTIRISKPAITANDSDVSVLKFARVRFVEVKHRGLGKVLDMFDTDDLSLLHGRICLDHLVEASA